MQKKIFFLLLAIVLLIAGILYKTGIFKGSVANQNVNPQVKIATLKPQDTVLKKELPGRVVAFQIAEIRPQVNGIISERMFNEGEFVEQGQQLYQIDPSTYKALYNSANANLRKVQANKKAALARKLRYDKFSGKGTVITKEKFEDAISKYEQAEAEEKMAEAELDKAKIMLDYTKVYAPISGYIGKSSFTKGALVTANQQEKLATITQLNPIYVDVTLSSTEFSKLKHTMGSIKNLPVELIMNNDQLYPAKGKLLFHEVNVDQSTSSVQLRTIFANEDKQLFPGMFVRLTIDETHKNSFLVPQNITWRDQKGDLFVWVVDDNNVANPLKIESVEIVGENWLVEKGLVDGTKVINSNFIHLKPGTQVSLQDSNEER